MKTNVVDLLTDRMWDRAGFADGQSMGGSGFGMAAVLGWPAMIGLLIGVRRARPVLLAALGMWLMLSAGVASDLFSGRFFMIVALALIASVAMIGWRIRPGVTRGLWRVLLATSVAWSVGVGVYHLAPRAAWGYWYLHGLGPVLP